MRKLLSILTILFACVTSHSQSALEMTIDEHLSALPVPERSHNAVVRHMEGIGAVYKKHGLDTRMMRRGEVLSVIVPASMLFAPNDTVLQPSAAKVLNAFNSILRLPGSYKVLVVAHSDDTGSPSYLEALTDARANAVDDFLSDANPTLTLNVIPYGVGNDEPRAANTSLAGRAANRRIEFVIIPDKDILDRARTNRL